MRILEILAVVILLLVTWRAAGFILLIILAGMYAAFCVGLMLVFKRLGWPSSLGLIPMYNYYYMVVRLGLPGRWFFLSMVPVLSPIYAVGIMGRLGKIFQRSLVWSMFWLTIGAPIGVYKLAFGKEEPLLELVGEPAPSIEDLKDALIEMKKEKAAAKTAKT